MYKFILFSVLIASSVFSQPLKLGFDTEVGVSHKNQEYLFGAELHLLYELNYNLEIGTALGASITGLEGRLGNYSGIISDLGVLLFYYPFNTRTRPFANFGVSYNLNLFVSGGTNPLGKSNLHNAIGYEIGIGLQNSIKEHLKLNIGLKYMYQNPGFSFDSYSNDYVQDFEAHYEISSLNLIFTLVLSL